MDYISTILLALDSVLSFWYIALWSFLPYLLWLSIISYLQPQSFFYVHLQPKPIEDVQTIEDLQPIEDVQPIYDGFAVVTVISLASTS